MSTSLFLRVPIQRVSLEKKIWKNSKIRVSWDAYISVRLFSTCNQMCVCVCVCVHMSWTIILSFAFFSKVCFFRLPQIFLFLVGLDSKLFLPIRESFRCRNNLAIFLADTDGCHRNCYFCSQIYNMHFFNWWRNERSLWRKFFYGMEIRKYNFFKCSLGVIPMELAHRAMLAWIWCHASNYH